MEAATTEQELVGAQGSDTWLSEDEGSATSHGSVYEEEDAMGRGFDPRR